jgi:hypothetical protein
MTKLKPLSAALIATIMFAVPAVARASHLTSRYGVEDANASTSPTARHIDGRVGISAPRVSVPAEEGNCDVGDNERIC